MNLPPEILKKVKLLEIQTRKLVNNTFAGEYHSAFKGQGMTFADFREYVPGDDVRAISWPLTARAGKPFIKKYDEERELTLMLVVDISGSQDFGTSQYFKGEAVAQLAAILGFSAVKNRDQIGMLMFSDQVEHFVPPRKGRGHTHRILRDLFYFRPQHRGTKISSALDYLQGVLKKRATVFIFSDFMDRGFESSLKMMGKKHDTIAVVINDRAEVALPDLGLIEMEDAETGQTLVVDTASPVFRYNFKKTVLAQREKRDSELKRAQVERVDIMTDHDIVDPLIRFFQRRHRR